MKKKRFSVEQIVGVLKQAEVGVPVAEVIRKAGISEQAFYRWKKQYVGLESDQVREMKQLQDENGRLKQLVAELSLDKTMLQDVLRKKWRSRRGAGRWSSICAISTGPANGTPAECCRSAAAPTATRAARKSGRNCEPASGRSRRAGCGTDVERSLCCCAEKAGRWVNTWCTGSTRKKACL